MLFANVFPEITLMRGHMTIRYCFPINNINEVPYDYTLLFSPENNINEGSYDYKLQFSQK